MGAKGRVAGEEPRGSAGQTALAALDAGEIVAAAFRPPQFHWIWLQQPYCPQLIWNPEMSSTQLLKRPDPARPLQSCNRLSRDLTSVIP